ncbi:MAG: outer membrane lipoprotein carrier protein LolA [Rhodospirillaceae bacterium]
MGREKIVLKVLAGLILAMFVMAAEARADAVPAKLGPAEQADVGRVERYLNTQKMLQAKFIQFADNGNKASGMFSMLRPGRMRLVYDPPVKDFIVSDGWFVFYWDDDLKQQSSQPLGSSLADFFLRETIHLSGDVTVTRLLRQNGILEITIAETTDPGKGQMTLVFEDKQGLQLRSWRVADAQGLTTTVILSDVRTSGLNFDDSMFLFRAPGGGTPRRNK